MSILSIMTRRLSMNKVWIANYATFADTDPDLNSCTIEDLSQVNVAGVANNLSMDWVHKLQTSIVAEYTDVMDIREPHEDDFVWSGRNALNHADGEETEVWYDLHHLDGHVARLNFRRFELVN